MLFYYARLGAGNPLWVGLCGVLLILVAAHGMYLLVGLAQPISVIAGKSDEASSLLNQLDNHRNVWMYIFPLATGAIGSNLISHALTYRRTSPDELDLAIRRLEESHDRLENISRRLLWVTGFIFGGTVLFVIGKAL